MAGPRLLVADQVGFLQHWPDLRDAAVVGVDLRAAADGLPLGLDPAAGRVEGAMFLGCAFPPGLADAFADQGAAVLSRLGAVPFDVYRSGLYTMEELTAGVEHGLHSSLDARITRWFDASSLASLNDLVARALHDATIDAAVARFVRGHRVVGVMGGHALRRDDPLYRRIAVLGRELSRRGFTLATGGGPGVMEAANLGAWCSPFGDDALDRAVATLAVSPSHPDDPEGYVRQALEVRRTWPAGGTSLGVPTWVYAQEPTGAFASHIAKYFTNSIREDGLLAIARSGVVYAPGGAGTQQEIFTDTAQNSLNLYEVRSPMVFLGADHYGAEHPELVEAARRQAAAFGWEDLIAVCDDPAEAVAFIDAHDPDRVGGAPADPRRSHRQG